MQDKLVIKGAREHNLKNVDLEIPRNKFVVMTGLSGSGKSSLAFDTIYAEGQRRYVESLSAYARQFLGQMDKPDVDYLEGLSPAISIDQKTTSQNPRSTVGTVTEIYDYLRLLYARVGRPHCPNCHKPITQQTVDQMVDQIITLPEGTKFQILAPIVRGRKGQHEKVLEDARKSGYVRARIDGDIKLLSEEINLEKNKQHTIEIVIDRLKMKSGIQNRLADSLESALSIADGLVNIHVLDEERELLFSQKYACIECGFSFPELAPRMFSFNSPYGACTHCDGLGEKREFDIDLIVPDKSMSINEGAILPWSKNKDGYFFNLLTAVCQSFGIDMDTPFEELSKEEQNLLLYGSGDEKFSFSFRTGRGRWYEGSRVFEGIIPNLSRHYKSTNSDRFREEIESYMASIPCSHCNGKRLRSESLAVKVGDMNIGQVTEMTVKEALDFFTNIELTDKEWKIARLILKEINERLKFLKDVGLEYLTLERSAGTLSGGEAQRIRLATQIGSSLTGVLYILDEPSIGLHQRDNERLIRTLENLRDIGNTLIVVEHDETTIRRADHLVDIGPGAGRDGGHVVAQGTIDDICDQKDSITGKFLQGEEVIPTPQKRRSSNGKSIDIKGAAAHNLDNVDVEIPMGILNCVTGVSGSGKSTLIHEVLYKGLAAKLHKARKKPGYFKEIKGIENLDKVIEIDQSPIGRTPRSNPATYTGVFDHIREIFSETPEARMRGYKPGRFSFNVRGGRCEACKGDGIIKIEMHFLPDVYVPCEVCQGKRYNRETLEVRYKGKTIADVLDMDVNTALEFFASIPKIRRKLQTVADVGLGYIKLGQPATTLSGGEAQRVKLASELSRRSNGRTLYILDEPTTGLHMADVKKLLGVLQRLVNNGDTVIVIEHDLDVIKTADHIIDLGPEGGSEGGRIIAQGTPEEVSQNEKSYTGQFLEEILKKRESA
ncbi:excinuclease ABC subunit UvrA [Natranaerobius thermophilus]|uniref:UvrABC system protein A n=1 Tax=Natranaerobius thermophilus (strain ATCC BAA-1301 / DSM 18059 / JW/NM-WN-LF) TaxID=457570 RepID=B2A712_NATTJ|nr:excinuclease ABC subunit UvrA [Natranaerobius thermophilus]ACB85603.1 Excinuclease ABC subunit A [Natranaerobius thermophilus JW/NM-WN-LF]